MMYVKGNIVTLDDMAEYEIIDVVYCMDNLYLYLKSVLTEDYTIVKAIEEKFYNLTNEEFEIVVANLIKNRCGC